MKRFLPILMLAIFALSSCSNGNDDTLPSNYIVTVTHDGNGTASADVTEAAKGTIVTLSAEPADGYQFDGWSVLGGGVTLADAAAKSTTFTMPAGVVSVKATFIVLAYSVTVTSDGNGTASADVAEAVEGATVRLTATANNSYQFAGWTELDGRVTFADAAAASTTFTMPAVAVEVKAYFVDRNGVLINGIVWAKYNVAAPGQFVTRVTDYGMLYQWNRLTAWSSSDPRSSIPAGAAWTSSEPNGARWETVSDPCPAGWRVPTQDEQRGLLKNGVTNAWVNGFNGTGVNGRTFTDDTTGAAIFLPASGVRSTDFSYDGVLERQGTYGFYWSTWRDILLNTWSLSLDRDGASLYGGFGAMACSVRCVRQ